MTNALWARVNAENVVAELAEFDSSLNVPELFSAGVGTWVNVSSISPPPQQGWTYATPSAFAAPSVPSPTLSQAAQAALTAGLAIASTGTPALDATYALDPATYTRIIAVSVYIIKNDTFPNSASTFAWPDATGALHTFPSTTEFEDFATAVANYIAALDLIVLSDGGSLPPASATIS